MLNDSFTLAITLLGIVSVSTYLLSQEKKKHLSLVHTE